MSFLIPLTFLASLGLLALRFGTSREMKPVRVRARRQR